MLIKFGKYRGTDLKDIPHNYLLWLMKNVEIDAELKTAIKKVLAGEVVEELPVRKGISDTEELFARFLKEQD